MSSSENKESEASAAFKRLSSGNARFQSNNLDHPHTTAERREQSTLGQAPFAIILNCADSRVIPELIFDQGIGDLFDVRVAGNIPNPSSLGSIEYAVAVLKTKAIVVMGHEACGAVGAAIKGDEISPNLDHLLSFVNTGGNTDVTVAVKHNVKACIESLTKNSDIIANAVENEGVEIVGAYYNLGSGKVDWLK
ncbi:MAG: carbonic anhydrase [Flavobacteriales bacterium]|nr:carbonic anhydrase [Flavobacteriales bacterium]